MFYFKTITINNASPELVEKAIRHYTKFRNSYLGFVISAGEFQVEQFFSGLEKKNILLITRMKDLPSPNLWGDDRPWRYRPMPAIFIRFNKENNFSSYQIRLGFYSMVFFCMASFWFFFSVWLLLHNDFNLGLLFFSLLFLIVFLFRTNREINKTKGLIDKAIQITSSDAHQQ
ncbi:hypothetical protein Niako_2648 [Niastella koreensis GR20-10]|uniref:Uncharacterized protein n=2 Tax=Niastella koreensis TaxID=354356 RepID=G8TR73_NIAKG|nr:hypothetical protein [Niastella koreensis]AEV98987.1 hypothetical protein Niako_2648 [Niastella koreensis GR20-10]